MSIPLNKLGQVSIVCGKTDMRQGIDSLAYWIQHHENDKIRMYSFDKIKMYK